MTSRNPDSTGALGRITRAVVLASAAALGWGVALGAQEGVQPVDFTHNVVDAPAPVAGSVFGSGPALHAGQSICTTPVQTTANVDTDCEKAAPTNETSIAVNPTNPDNIIGGANDYQLGINFGGHVTESIHSRAHVTFSTATAWRPEQQRARWRSTRLRSRPRCPIRPPETAGSPPR